MTDALGTCFSAVRPCQTNFAVSGMRLIQCHPRPLPAMFRDGKTIFQRAEAPSSELRYYCRIPLENPIQSLCAFQQLPILRSVTNEPPQSIGDAIGLQFSAAQASYRACFAGGCQPQIRCTINPSKGS
jgi:hypothetical protein